MTDNPEDLARYEEAIRSLASSLAAARAALTRARTHLFGITADFDAQGKTTAVDLAINTIKEIDQTLADPASTVAGNVMTAALELVQEIKVVRAIAVHWHDEDAASKAAHGRAMDNMQSASNELVMAVDDLLQAGGISVLETVERAPRGRHKTMQESLFAMFETMARKDYVGLRDDHMVIMRAMRYVTALERIASMSHIPNDAVELAKTTVRS